MGHGGHTGARGGRGGALHGGAGCRMGYRRDICDWAVVTSESSGASRSGRQSGCWGF